MIDGFYIVYLTGNAGNNVAVFVVRQGEIVGVDGATMKYDGTVTKQDGSKGYKCSVVYTVPPNVPLITGAPSLKEAMRVPLTFELPENFADGVFVTIVTPLGPVNARFEKVRDLEKNHD